MTTGPTTDPQAVPQAPPAQPQPGTQVMPPGQNEPATQATEPTEEQRRLANEQLRTWAEGVATENKQLKTLAMRSALVEIGLNPEEGLGLAIVETYNGEITDDAVATFAAEKYKYGATQQPQGQVDPAVAAAQRAEALTVQGQSVVPQPQQTPGQAATAKVDGNDPEVSAHEALMSVNAKAAQFMAEHYPNQSQQ